MNKKIKIIDLLCLISNGEEVPKKIKIKDEIWIYDEIDYRASDDRGYLFEVHTRTNCQDLNEEIEILDDEEDKDIPLIPDDELWVITKKGGIAIDDELGIDRYVAINFNFKVLKEKINQIAEELNKRQ